jgi:hypothetical protein
MKISIEATVFLKLVGLHRGRPRIYFQEATRLSDAGFTPGAPYTVDTSQPDMVRITANDKGNRKVCKKVVGSRTMSIIDLNHGLDIFKGETQVSVSISKGSIQIRKLAIIDLNHGLDIFKGETQVSVSISKGSIQIRRLEAA